ncbi:MAG: nucleoside 2-deoxyribosyltransferase [Sphingomonas sp.]|uniref:PfkB family carbohydrate kinase n=1 Tax=Sphingomonas sp. TaxID=28214 RepID=UPI0025E1BA11|nr:PfkB family carbohydrate kinase [Sphingomonas sp.]MBQ1500344.1 nucleoside 2-deoxyribosyltransferase [Sphingomonas sp.]MBQ8104234.1 nucleoside 2-deoxyribosyltransferase [Afipia sp.]
MTTVAGGLYLERCIEPRWDDVYGSGGRAAAALSAAVPGIKLMTYRPTSLEDGEASLKSAYGISIDGPVVEAEITFDYFHTLATPKITPRPDAIIRCEPFEVADDVVLRFGMLEGDARVRARTAVYDPQSAFDPRPFAENGSKADRVALILNRLEARRFSGENDPERGIEILLARGEADVIVLKMGGHGALVATKEGRWTVPAYRSDTVFKIGSGDVFSAAFTQFWALEGRTPAESADFASRAVSQYVNTRSLPISSANELLGIDAEPINPGKGRIYLAAPFFNLAERWIVEEIRNQLMTMNVPVFSPLHDVGEGPGEVVAPLDLKGLDECQAVLAILNGTDAGTVFEVGYAVARGTPVVALAQNMRPEDVKMPAGTGCRIVDDLVSSIYHAIWALP